MNYEKLRQLMFERHENKLRVSKATGVSYPTFINWEKGRSTPTLATIKTIADYFEVPVSYFLDE